MPAAGRGLRPLFGFAKFTPICFQQESRGLRPLNKPPYWGNQGSPKPPPFSYLVNSFKKESKRGRRGLRPLLPYWLRQGNWGASPPNPPIWPSARRSPSAPFDIRGGGEATDDGKSPISPILLLAFGSERLGFASPVNV